jgi:hypothetical protein
MVKPLSALLFVIVSACLTCAPVRAQSNNVTSLYWGCTQEGWNENYMCVTWGPTTGSPPAYPAYGYSLVGYIKTVAAPGTVSLYYGCVNGQWDYNNFFCSQWAMTTTPPAYNSNFLGYIKTAQGLGTVPLYYGCVNGQWDYNNFYCSQWAATTTPPAYNSSLLGYIDSGINSGDDCDRTGLNMCILFEATPDTQFTGTTVTSRTYQSAGSSVTWSVENAGNDAANDINRINRSSGGRDLSSGIWLQTLDSDVGVHGADLFTERSEISLTTGDTGAVAGADQWWAHSLFVPVESNLPSTANSQVGVFQFHGDPVRGGQPNFILHIRNQDGPNPHTIFRAYSAGTGGVNADGTQYTYNITGGSTNVIGQCIFDDFQKGYWYDFVHHIRWSNTASGGSHEIWMRKGNGPVTKVLNKTGISTLYTNAQGQPDQAYLKLGLYHDLVPGSNTSIIHDRIRRGTTADAVRMPDFTVNQNASVVFCTGTSAN